MPNKYVNGDGLEYLIQTIKNYLSTKVDDSQVLTNVPAGAKFTDTITTINGKTGTITKADITALGIPAQDTVYTHPANHPASIITQDASNRFVTDAEKTAWNDVALKANATDLSNLAGTGRTTETVKANADAIANRARTLSNGDLQSVTNKNMYYPLLSNVAGELIGTHQTLVWSGVAWTASNNYGFGHYALSNNTGGNSNGFGYYALSSNTGGNSSGFGTAALSSNTGDRSNGFGYYALSSNTGTYSNGFGYNALENNTGDRSSGFGYSALRNNTGTYSNGFGYYALSNNTGANSNGIGYNALRYNKSPNNTAIGHNANSVSLTYGNTTCLGANTVANKDNQVVLGDTAVDTVKMGGTARTPASATATGVKGEMCWDADYIYVCVATDTWKRSALSTW